MCSYPSFPTGPLFASGIHLFIIFRSCPKAKWPSTHTHRWYGSIGIGLIWMMYTICCTSRIHRDSLLSFWCFWCSAYFGMYFFMTASFLYRLVSGLFHTPQSRWSHNGTAEKPRCVSWLFAKRQRCGMGRHSARLWELFQIPAFLITNHGKHDQRHCIEWNVVSVLILSLWSSFICQPCSLWLCLWHCLWPFLARQYSIIWCGLSIFSHPHCTWNFPLDSC